MPDLKPPKGFKHGLTAEERRNRAEAALGSPLGQEALRQEWGRGLYEFVMDWGSLPSQPKTIEALKRAANELKWDLLEMRRSSAKDDLSRALLRFYESANALEDELRVRFYGKDNAP